MSPTRWFSEAFYIKEMENRQWTELHDGSPLKHGYSYKNRDVAQRYIVFIGLGWLVCGYITIKLVNRRKMK
jgi:hypothetical protein